MNLLEIIALATFAIVAAVVLLHVFGITTTVLLPELKYIVPTVLIAMGIAFYGNQVAKSDEEEVMVKHAVQQDLPLPRKYDKLVDKYEYTLTKEAMTEVNTTDIVKPDIINLSE